MPLPVYARYRQAFIDALSGVLSVPATELSSQVKPAEAPHGDLSFATFALAKAQKKPPPALAAQIASQLNVPGVEVVQVGPYVNARFLAQPFTGEVIDSARTAGARFGHSDAGTGKTVVIDYSSPNIAKPIGFHHIRSTMIGHSVANLLRAQGYRVEGINYLGDWGKQFGLVAIGLEEYGDPALRHEVAHLVDVYVKANARAEAEPAFDERAREWFRRMENGDEAALAIWQEVRETSLKDFRRVYARLGVEFEHYEGESRYQGKMEPVVEEISRTVGTRESDGALIVDMPYEENEPPVLLKKNDGSTLYVTRDLAAAIDRFERFQFDQSLYVVATDQALHFRQLFRVLEKMGRPFASRMVHVNFGRVRGMSTRAGKIKLLTEVLDEAKKRAMEKVQENITAGRIHTSDPDALAEQIGLGAIVFGDLKNRRTTDYEFNWEQVLDFEGHTGPYLQYAHARTCAVLRKGGGVPTAYDASLLTLPEEQAVVRLIARFPGVVSEAASDYEPSFVARALLELAAAFSRWYTLGNQDRQKRILLEDNDAVRAARLALTDAVRLCLVSGLTLLGVPSPESM